MSFMSLALGVLVMAYFLKSLIVVIRGILGEAWLLGVIALGLVVAFPLLIFRL